jgi:DNA-binding NtrC family response regulator
MDLQAKLLRVLQEKTFRKVGGAKEIPSAATIIASSNRNLLQETRRGNFRPDLYYRLATFPIVLPPLRDENRRDDVPLLAEYFVETLGRATPTVRRELSAEAKHALQQCSWPGNVRELRNVIERALILEKGPQITPASLLFDAPGTAEHGVETPPLSTEDLSLETAERLFITRAMQEAGWQRTRAAALLGITRATLHAKLKRYNITMPVSRPAVGAPPANPAASRLQQVGAS